MASISARKNAQGEIISFSIRVYRGRDLNGKQLPTYTTTFPWPAKCPHTPEGETKAHRAAEKFAAKFEIECAAEEAAKEVAKAKVTFTKYAADVLAYRANLSGKKGLAATTYRRYQELLARVNPIIGAMKLTDIDAICLRKLETQLSSTPNKSVSARAKPMLNELIQNGSIGDNADESIIKYAAKRIPHASVAKAAGIATSTLDAALANRSIQVEKAIAIANALGHSVDDLFLLGEKEYFLSPKTVREHLNVVSSVLEYATREQLIAQNPANFVDKPEAELGEREHYSKEEVREIITALESLDESQIHWVTMTFVLIFSGIRRGEDLGLSIDDVDFDQNTISIHGDLVYVSGLGLILKKRPKSDDSVRVITLPDFAMQKIREYLAWRQCKEEQAGGRFENSDWADKNLIFINPATGTPFHPDSLTAWCNKFSERHNLPHINPHAFRHTVATLLFESEEISTEEIRDVLGHKDFQTTKTIYIHAAKRRNAKSTAVLENAIFGTKDKNH